MLKLLFASTLQALLVWYSLPLSVRPLERVAPVSKIVSKQRLSEYFFSRIESGSLDETFPRSEFFGRPGHLSPPAGVESPSEAVSKIRGEV